MSNQNQVLEKVRTIRERIPTEAHLEQNYKVALVLSDAAQTDHSIIPLLFGFLSDQWDFYELLQLDI